MPSTRSTQRADEEDASVEQEPEQEDAVTPATKKGSRRPSSRELRRKKREEMRTRNMGLGVSISTEHQNTKVVFPDDGEEEEARVQKEEEEQAIDEIEKPDSEEIDEDDAVEEVKGSVARETILEQRAQERETATLQTLQSRPKKRKRQKPPKDEEEEEDFDEDFFAQVDSEMVERRKKQNNLEPMGRHTTFVVDEDEDAEPIQTNHNIELVVLGKDVRDTGMEPTEASHLFARGRLMSGKDQAKKKGSKKKKQTDPGWKRSKKMNARIGKARRRRGRGVAAAKFVVKSK